MGKHLTIKEKLNAKKELLNNKEKIKQLRDEINQLIRRNYKLQSYLHNIERGNYQGMCYANSMTYKMYGKKKDELTAEEIKEYNKLKQRESRAKQKGVINGRLENKR